MRVDYLRPHSYISEFEVVEEFRPEKCHNYIYMLEGFKTVGIV